jgi:hypothetical protein
MTSVLIQGMRRSGTTVFYDLLCQAGGYDAWYEPFGPAKGNRNFSAYPVGSAVRCR